MKYGLLVPTLNADPLNPDINLSNTPFYVQDKLSKWENGREDKNPLRAAVSSFGAGGSNACMVIEEYKEKKQHQEDKHAQSDLEKPFYLIGLSANSKVSLNSKVEDLLQWLEDNHQEYSLDAIVYTLNSRRVHFDNRYAIIVSSVDELIKALRNIQEGEKGNNIFISNDLEIGAEERAIYNKVFEGIVNTLHSVHHTQVEQYSNNLKALAGLYVKGYDIDWKLFYHDEWHQHIFLPTYPFEKKRYWLDDSLSSVPVSKEQSIEAITGQGKRIFMKKKFS